jgi:hypothetical protein
LELLPTSVFNYGLLGRVKYILRTPACIKRGCHIQGKNYCQAPALEATGYFTRGFLKTRRTPDWKREKVSPRKTTADFEELY